MVEGENRAVQEAMNLSYDEIEKLALEEAEEEQASRPAETKNAVGSYERLMAQFAGTSMVQKEK